MKAMIFAAGLGTRMQPLTNNKPKALVEVGGKTLLETVILRLKHFGFNNILINVHHFADMIENYIKEKNNFGINISFSDERDLLLDTGGGLKKAEWFFNDNQPFLIHNVDVLTDLNLLDLYNNHVNNNALITLAVTDRSTSRQLLFNNEKELCGWKNVITGETKMSRFNETNLNPKAYSCIQVMNPAIFSKITENGVFSIIDVYLRLAKTEKITYFSHNQTLWLDLGRKDNIEEAAGIVKKMFAV